MRPSKEHSTAMESLEELRERLKPPMKEEQPKEVKNRTFYMTALVISVLILLVDFVISILLVGKYMNSNSRSWGALTLLAIIGPMLVSPVVLLFQLRHHVQSTFKKTLCLLLFIMLPFPIQVTIWSLFRILVPFQVVLFKIADQDMDKLEDMVVHTSFVRTIMGTSAQIAVHMAFIISTQDHQKDTMILSGCSMALSVLTMSLLITAYDVYFVITGLGDLHKVLYFVFEAFMWCFTTAPRMAVMVMFGRCFTYFLAVPLVLHTFVLFTLLSYERKPSLYSISSALAVAACFSVWYSPRYNIDIKRSSHSYFIYFGMLTVECIIMLTLLYLFNNCRDYWFIDHAFFGVVASFLVGTFLMFVTVFVLKKNKKSLSLRDAPS